MTDKHDDTEDQVSRLLAAAATTPSQAAIPDEVGERLDLVLAGLVSERAGQAAEGTHGSDSARPDEAPGVTGIESRRRRRWAQVLVAAAALSVVGVGLGNVVGSDMEQATTAESAGRGGSGEEADGGAAAAPKATTDSGPADSQGPEAYADRDGVAALDTRRGIPRLRSGSLTFEVQRIEDFALALPVAGSRRSLSKGCARPETDAGDEWLRVRLDGEPAVLVLRAPASGRRTAEVFTCDDAGSPVASTTVEAR